MNYNIEFSEEFTENTNEISKYLYEITFNKDLVSKIQWFFYSWAYSLQVFPYRYQENENWYRALNIKSYKIFYKIFRVLWSSMNFKTYF